MPFHNIRNQVSIKSLDRFCLTAAIMSALCLVLYAILRLYVLVGIMAFVTLVFWGIMYLNKRNYHFMARVLIVCATNIGVLAFSVYLGFNSGIFLYLYAAPHLIYLLFNIRQKATTIICMASYVFTFLVTYVIDYFHLVNSISLPAYTINIIYALNFLSSITFSFVLITMFAQNNDKYIDMLVDTNRALQEQQTLLQIEVADKNKKNTELAKALKEKDILLQEIHHRVKNNLAVISGLVELQNFYVKDEKASSILKESRNRIKSIALLHEKFYESKSLEKIEIRSYIDELIYFIKLSFSSQQKEIKIHTQIDHIELSLKDALPFSLLLNELITNSYKHAFKNLGKGNIYISLIKNTEELIFHFKDDGSGFDYSTDIKETTLGLNLIEAFSKQLKGEMSFDSKKSTGTEFNLHFKS
ncbi:MAG TPA: sensor histidine kinase [Bacteroidia bacterium]|nr:sensor histidine kinase [Bacteroidia bacterium]